MSRENVQTARRMIELYNAGDVAGCILFAAPDIVCHPAEGEPETRVVHGSEAWGEYLRDALDIFVEYEVETSEYIDLGECVVVVGSIHGRGRASGVKVSSDEVWLFRFSDGKAVEYRECGTKARALKAAAQRE